MARTGHAVMQSSHTLHMSGEKSTSMVSRLIDNAPVGQTAVQAPQ